MKFIYPEGATPLDDISNLKMPWIKCQEDLNHVEVENIGKAVSKYLLKSVKPPEQWFDIPFLQKIYKDMFSDVWGWAGKFRTTQTSPGIKSYQIQEALKQLCEDVKFWNIEKTDLTPIEQSAKIHHRLVFIHPFTNGNGRFSRLVADRYLKAIKHSFPNWPVDIDKDGPLRKEYIRTLREADSGNYDSLILYIQNHLS